MLLKHFNLEFVDMFLTFDFVYSNGNPFLMDIDPLQFYLVIF